MAKKKTEPTPIKDKNIIHKLTPATALILGIALFIAGIVLTALSVKERTDTFIAIDYFRSSSYIRPADEHDSTYNGHGIVTTGTLTYDEAGAVDAIFGVSADAPVIFRISEMYQWQEVIKDGKAQIEGVWSEELIESPDENHANPTAYPANVKSNFYTAKSAALGDYTVSSDLLLLFDGREALTELPMVDVRGYKTVGEYVTNTENMDSPNIGDVRIRYEYLTAKTVTVLGKQREETIVAYNNYSGYKFFLGLEGEHTKAEMVSALKADAPSFVWWMLALGAVLSVIGAVILFDGFTRAKKYSPRVPSLSEKLGEITAPASCYVYSVTLGVLAFALSFTGARSALSPLPILFVSVAAVIYLYILISDMVKNMPRRVKKEAEYVPILVKRDEKRRK